jgi:general stress protein 26
MAIHRLIGLSGTLAASAPRPGFPEQMSPLALVPDTPDGDRFMSLTLPELAKKMQKIDFCMMITKSEFGAIASRPMSNNGEVDYDGDSYFFSYTDTRKIRELTADPTVSLSFTAPPSLLGKPGIFVSVEGRSSLIADKAVFQAHWTSGLDRWFPEGIDTPGVVLIKVHADTIQYWDGEDNGVIRVSP